VLDFVKSVDSVYKEFRLLNASIENSSRIDKAFETLFNIRFTPRRDYDSDTAGL
jgi:hypothetical protein